jgi:polysaccharide chain length determinant protein (PEP-CTERM system associated)
MAIRQLTPDDAIGILRKRWAVLLLLAVVGAGAGWEVARVLPKKYKSQTVVLVEQPTVPGDLVRPIVIENVNQRLASMREEILSGSHLTPIIKKFNLYPEAVSQGATSDDLVDELRKAINVTPIEPMQETGSAALPGFTVQVTFNDPLMAQQLSSAVTSMFMEANSQARQASVEETSDFLSGQLEDAKVKLDVQDAKLADFKRRYMGTLPDEEGTNSNILMGLTSQLDATTQALSRAQQDKSFTESMLAQQLANFQISQENGGQTTDALETQLTALQGQLAELRSKYTDSYPDVVKIKMDIAHLQKSMADASKLSQAQPAASEVATKPPVEPAQIQALRAQIHQHDEEIKERTTQQDELQQQIKTYQTRVQSSPAVEQEYKALTRDYQTALDFYNDLLRKRNDSTVATNLEKRQEGEQFKVLDPADLPTEPSFPKVQLFIPGGAVGGLGLGVALFLLMELFDTSLRNEQELEKLLQLPVLATVPTIKGVFGKSASSPFGAGLHS